MIRILHVVTIMDVAGLETLIMNLYRNIDRNEVQVDFLTHRNEKGTFDDEIKALGSRVYSVSPINPFHHKRYLRELDDFIIMILYILI